MHTYTVLQWHVPVPVPPVVGLINIHWLHICYLYALLGQGTRYGSIVVIRHSRLLVIFTCFLSV